MAATSIQRRPVETGTTRGDRTRAAVIAAARGRFEIEAFEGTTLARIAADAGVSEPTIVFHFGSKAGLLVAVMRAYYDDLLAAVDEVIDGSKEPVARLRDFARWWLPHNAEHYELVAVFGRQGRRTEPDEVVDAFRECNRRVTRVFDRLVDDLKHLGVLRDDVSTRITRDAFFGTSEHLMIGRALTGRPDDLEAAADDLLDLLFDGAATRATEGGIPTPGPEADRPDLATIDVKLDRLLERLPDPSRSTD